MDKTTPPYLSSLFETVLSLSGDLKAGKQVDATSVSIAANMLANLTGKDSKSPPESLDPATTSSPTSSAASQTSFSAPYISSTTYKTTTLHSRCVDHRFPDLKPTTPTGEETCQEGQYLRERPHTYTSSSAPTTGAQTSKSQLRSEARPYGHYLSSRRMRSGDTRLSKFFHDLKICCGTSGVHLAFQ
ncbi:hypothetical protein HK097_006315, partial [Rhizophlyctis rosea]